MSTKFEQLLDFLVNEETDKANELFHEIVVEKSREIYENLIAEEEEEDTEVEETADADADDAEVEETADADADDSVEESLEEMFGEEEEAFPVQDQTDDFADDSADDTAMGDDEFGGEEEGGEEAATKDDVLDLKDALEELKAEFEALMAGEKHEEEENPDVHGGELDGFGDEESEEDGEEEADDEEEEAKGNPFAESTAPKSQGEKMREYIEKVTATMDGGLVGARTGETVSAPKEGSSPISSGSGKPTSGANAKNVAQAGTGSNEDGTAPKGKVGGLVKTGGDFVKAGTKNVASSASAKKPDGSKLTGVSKPSNKEGSPVGSGTGDKAGQTSGVITKSPLSGAPK